MEEVPGSPPIYSTLCSSLLRVYKSPKYLEAMRVVQRPTSRIASIRQNISTLSTYMPQKCRIAKEAAGAGYSRAQFRIVCLEIN